jgi:hypothetical protein
MAMDIDADLDMDIVDKYFTKEQDFVNKIKRSYVRTTFGILNADADAILICKNKGSSIKGAVQRNLRRV